MRVIIYTDTDGDCSAQHCCLAAMGLSLGIVQGVSLIGSFAHSQWGAKVRRGGVECERGKHSSYSGLRHLALCIEQWFSKCGPQTRIVTGELVRRAHSLAPPQTY